MNLDELEKRLGSLKEWSAGEAPEGFTRSVMDRLPPNGPQNARSLWGRLICWHLREPGPVAFYLFLASFGHLVMALVLAIGLGKMDSPASGSSWLAFQPPIFLFLAAWLFLLGFLRRKDRKTEGPKAVLIAAFGYFWIVILNIGVLFARYKPVFNDMTLYGLLLAGLILFSLLAAVGFPGLQTRR